MHSWISASRFSGTKSCGTFAAAAVNFWSVFSTSLLTVRHIRRSGSVTVGTMTESVCDFWSYVHSCSTRSSQFLVNLMCPSAVASAH